MTDKVRVGVVGLGYWGPNLARNFDRLPDAELAYCCDLDEANLAKARSLYPATAVTDDYAQLLADDDAGRRRRRHLGAHATTRSARRRSRPASTPSSRSPSRSRRPTPRTCWTRPRTRASSSWSATCSSTTRRWPR